MQFTIRMANTADGPALQRLGRRQAARLFHADPRLPDEVTLPIWLLLPEGGACWLASDAAGDPLAALAAEREEWSPESPFANVFPRAYLRMRYFGGDAADPALIFPALLARADGWAGAGRDAGRMLLHPGCDTALGEALAAAGFTPYHTIAHQPLPEDVPDSPPADLEIRHATRYDVSAVAALMAESWQFHAAHQPAILLSESILEGCQRQTRFMLGDGVNRALLIALWQGEVVGFFSIGLSLQDALARPALFHKGYYGDIYEVGVRGDQRRRGIGRAMYAAAWRWFMERHVRGIFVNYAPTNPLSSQFWPALGFRDAWVNWWRA